MFCLTLILVSFMLTSAVYHVTCQTYEDVNNLLKDIFNGTIYNPAVRPVRDQTSAVVIQFSHGMDRIENLDVTSGTLVVHAFVVLSWFDEFMTWDPALYGGLTRVQVPAGKVWTPSLVLTDGKDDGRVINPYLSPTSIFYNGMVMLYSGNFYQTKCDIDTSLFPFDKHLCTFYFVESGHVSSEVVFEIPQGQLMMDYYHENEIWTLENTKSFSDSASSRMFDIGVSTITIQVEIKRRSGVELLSSYVPIAALSALNVVACFVPPDSGERLSVAVTLYLSFIFATTALIDRLPRNALKIAMTSYSMLSLNILNTAAVIWSVLIVRISRRDVKCHKIPKVMVNVLSWTVGLSRVTPVPEKSVKKQASQSDKEILEVNDLNDSDVMDTKEYSTDCLSATSKVEISWLDFALFLDKIAGLLMTISTLLIFIVLICNWSNNFN